MTADNIPLTVAWFPHAIVPDNKPAIGDPEHTTWGNFAGVFWWRREGPKDGPCFACARFTLEPDGRHVRRLKRNAVARTAIALDCETDKKTGEVPPDFADAAARVRASGLAGLIYTSHNHRADAPRYRIVLPLSAEIDPELPAPEVVANRLGLAGVLDASKVGASSLFYLPSAGPGQIDHHHALVIDGAPLDAAWMRETAGAILAEADRIAALAHAEAAARRAAKIAAGLGPDDSLIDKLRLHFDLADVLASHGYDKSGSKFRHPNSSSGSYGADIKTFGGIERVYSHNGTDPLHASNLPAWCGGVTALDVVDVVTILDFGGNRTKALAELARRFSLTKTDEQRKLAGLIYRLIRRQTSQQDIEAAAYAEGERLGLSRAEVIRVAVWIASQATIREAA